MRKNSKIGRFHHNIFYEIPIRLIYEEKYRGLSDSAKISYSILKNRLVVDGHYDEQMNMYVKYLPENLNKLFYKSQKETQEIIKELVEYQLIEIEYEENCIRIYLADLSISSNDLEEWL